MTRKLKPVEFQLDEDIQQAVRSIPMQMADGSVQTVGSLLKKAVECLDAANKSLQENSLVRLTAAHLMKSGKRRGHPVISIRLDGSVYLQVVYDEHNLVTQIPGLTKPKGLPNLSALRAEAEGLGVDISDLGRHKRKIMARLKSHKTQETSQ